MPRTKLPVFSSVTLLGETIEISSLAFQPAASPDTINFVMFKPHYPQALRAVVIPFTVVKLRQFGVYCITQATTRGHEAETVYRFFTDLEINGRSRQCFGITVLNQPDGKQVKLVVLNDANGPLITDVEITLSYEGLRDLGIHAIVAAERA